MKGNTNLIGRKCLEVFKPLKDISLIVGLLDHRPTRRSYLAKRLNLSSLYVKDLVDVLVEAGAVTVRRGRGGGITLNPIPIPLWRVVEIIEDKPYNNLPNKYNYADLVVHELREAIADIDIARFASSLNLRRRDTGYPK